MERFWLDLAFSENIGAIMFRARGAGTSSYVAEGKYEGLGSGENRKRSFAKGSVILTV